MVLPVIWTPYCGAAPAPGELLARWNLDPLLLIGLAAAGLAYRRWVDAPERRGGFAAAFAVAAFLFVSPFCALSSALFSARVTHHVLVAAVLAPLLVRAIPPARLRLPGGLGGWTFGHALAFWLWHSPPAYGWALSTDAGYWLMQAMLGGSAFGFWWKVRAAEPPAAVAALLATTVQMGLLGALITFAGRPLYGPHLWGPQLWGFTPLEDQQLAGILMWAPACAIYLVAALLIAGRWLRRPQPAFAA